MFVSRQVPGKRFLGWCLLSVSWAALILGATERIMAQPGYAGGRNDGTASSAVEVVLRDGSSFEVDGIEEGPDRYIYRMGGMLGFLDRADVQAVRPAGNVTGGRAEAPDPLSASFTTGHRALDQLIVEAGARHGIDPLLIYLVMREESGFNYRAVSRIGARGLMQLMPSTARWLGVRNILNPRENIDAGTRYLRHLVEAFGGDVNLALAAYNAGESAVWRYGGRIPPYRETRRYVWRINAAYRLMKAG